jgi:hypothetical protein
MLFSAVDWQQPWLSQWRALAEPLAHDDWRCAINEAARVRLLTNQHRQPIRFVPQQVLPEHVAYEAHINASGEVPTRDNLHDFFNAMVWLRFPQIKRALNALQATEIHRNQTASELSGTRGRQRDAATLFDENAALLICSDANLIAALRRHDWKEALWERRASFGASCEVVLFGHALLEKLVHPYKAVTAHAWIVMAEPSWFALTWPQRINQLDASVAQRLSAGFTSADFTPLPILGVPGWWPGQDASFYEDVAVFRPKRKN